MSRTVCSWCHAPLVLDDDVYVCSNVDCAACAEKFLHQEITRLRNDLKEVTALFDIESKNHWHKHRLALKLQEQLSVAIDGITYIRNNCLGYAADYMDKADEILEQIKQKENKCAI